MNDFLPDSKPFYRGKVRDVYEVDKKKLLIVATDRISCFDYILPTPIPGKGKILTRLSVFWFDYVKDIIPNHLITADINKYPKPFNEKSIDGRSMLVHRADRIDIECVARGYLSGSGWKEYKKSGIVSGIKLPAGLRESDKLPEPIFTPSTKADSGHDMNITYEDIVKNKGIDLAKFLKETTIELYTKASKYTETCGIILADTKFEFGVFDGKKILIDEIFTPDSSRFWDREKYEPGRPQESFDKQFVRDYLESIKWNKEPPVPELPEEIVKKTQQKYQQSYDRIKK